MAKGFCAKCGREVGTFLKPQGWKCPRCGLVYCQNCCPKMGMIFKKPACPSCGVELHL